MKHTWEKTRARGVSPPGNDWPTPGNDLPIGYAHLRTPLVQAVYESEGVSWEHVDFEDNQVRLGHAGTAPLRNLSPPSPTPLRCLA